MVIFIGDKPSPRMKPGAKAFQGAVCEPRMYAWAKEITSLENCSFINWTDPKFASYLSEMAGKPDTKIVAVGNNAAHVLNTAGIPHFKLTHPSGRNRLTNDKEFIAKQIKACKDYVERQSGS